jgi:hypothetical protein
MSIHVEITNPVLSRISKDPASGELILEFRHHSDTVILVWYVEGSRNRAAARQELDRIGDIGAALLDKHEGPYEWNASKPPARRRRALRALDRAGLTESGPRPITSTK